MPVDFRIREHLHPIALLRTRRMLERTQWLPADELRRWQADRLRGILCHAARHVPHYHHLFQELGRSPEIEDPHELLSQLPILTKQDLRESGDALVARNAKRHGARWSSTSGTSGVPVRFLLDRHARVLEFCYYWRHWSWAGYRLGQRFAELSTTHFLAPGRDAEALLDWQAHTGRLLLNAARIRPDRAQEIRSALRRRRPRYLKGTASALDHMARCLEQRGGGGHRFSAVFSTGEVLAPVARARLEATFQAPVLDSYGHMERTVAIAQCLHGGYHVQADYGLLELREPRTSADGRTLATVTGTGFFNRAMPLLRYDVGDAVQPAEEGARCPCGRTLPLVAAIHGRSEDVVRTPDGRRLTALYCLVEPEDNVDRFQIRQAAVDLVEFLIVPGRGWSAKHRRQIEARAGRALGAGMRLRTTLCRGEDLERSPSGKFRVVVGLSPDELGG